MNSRAKAVQVITDVTTHGMSLTAALEKRLIDSKQDKALVSELSFGVIRWWHYLVKVLDYLLKKPFKNKDSDIRILIMVGLYQLIYLRIPDHAAINETVNASLDFNKKWAKSVINGVLRSYQRQAQDIINALECARDIEYSHPAWLLTKLKSQWPQDWRDIVEHNNKHAPMCLRVNRLATTKESYIEQLAQAEIEAKKILYTLDGVQLNKPVDISLLPNFVRGYASVQDGAAQMAAALLNVGKAHRVLDACAAPGGKSAHLLEYAPQLQELVCVDIDNVRLAKVTQNLQRLNLHATVVEGDALLPGRWWDGRQFDRILMDAPCSASGVIRRHPDIKLLRREQDITHLVNTQSAMLEALWPLLKPEGELLYATCSVLKEENEQQIADFLLRHSDAQHQPIEADWGRAGAYGRQILPGENDMDGFYYAKLVKQ